MPGGWEGQPIQFCLILKNIFNKNSFSPKGHWRMCSFTFFQKFPHPDIFFVCLWRCGERRRQKRLGTPVTGWWAPGVEGGHLRHINCPQQAIKPPPPSPYGPKLSTINGWCYLPPSQWLPKLYHYICRNHSWAKHRLQRHTMQSNARPIGMGVTVKTTLLKIYDL